MAWYVEVASDLIWRLRLKLQTNEVVDMVKRDVDVSEFISIHNGKLESFNGTSLWNTNLSFSIPINSWCSLIRMNSRLEKKKFPDLWCLAIEPKMHLALCRLFNKQKMTSTQIILPLPFNNLFPLFEKIFENVTKYK